MAGTREALLSQVVDCTRDGKSCNTRDPHAEIMKGGKINYAVSYQNGVGVAEQHGRRPSQEDRVVVGTASAEGSPNWSAAFGQTIAALEAKIEADEAISGIAKEQGSCLLTSMVVGNKVYTANVGDSQGFIVKIDVNNNVTVEPIVKTLHKPSNVAEKEYIESHDGVVVGGRLNAIVAVSRAMGDTEHGEAIRHTPDLYETEVDLKGGRAFVILGCDGLSDNLTTAQIKDLIQADTSLSPAQMAGMLARNAEKGTVADNISVMVTPIDANDPTPKFSAVFDGHAGSMVSEYLYQNFTKSLDLTLKEQMMNRNQAEAHLQGKSAGTCVVRKSSQNPRDIVLSYITDDRKISHVIYSPQPNANALTAVQFVNGAGQMLEDSIKLLAGKVNLKKPKPLPDLPVKNAKENYPHAEADLLHALDGYGAAVRPGNRESAERDLKTSNQNYIISFEKDPIKNNNFKITLSYVDANRQAQHFEYKVIADERGVNISNRNGFSDRIKSIESQKSTSILKQTNLQPNQYENYADALKKLVNMDRGNGKGDRSKLAADKLMELSGKDREGVMSKLKEIDRPLYEKVKSQLVAPAGKKTMAVHSESVFDDPTQYLPKTPGRR